MLRRRQPAVAPTVLPLQLGEYHRAQEYVNANEAGLCQVAVTADGAVVLVDSQLRPLSRPRVSHEESTVVKLHASYAYDAGHRDRLISKFTRKAERMNRSHAQDIGPVAATVSDLRPAISELQTGPTDLDQSPSVNSAAIGR